jgi:hypothetical protein
MTSVAVPLADNNHGVDTFGVRGDGWEAVGLPLLQIILQEVAVLIKANRLLLVNGCHCAAPAY